MSKFDDDYIKNAQALAVSQSRLDDLRRQIGDDKDIQHALRVAAWLHVDRSRVRPLGDGDIECPPDFPPGVDQEAMIEANINAVQRGDSPGRRYSVVQFARDYLRRPGGDDE